MPVHRDRIKNYKIYFIVGNEMGTLHIYFFILSNLKDIIYFYIIQVLMRNENGNVHDTHNIS